MVHTSVCDALDIDYPIFQGGLGPNGTVELAAAISNAGGLGTVSQGGANATKSQARSFMRDQLSRVTELTDNSIAVNVPVGNLDDPIKHIRTREAYINEALRMKEENRAVRDRLKLLITSYGSPERKIDDIERVKENTDLLHFHKVANVHHAEKVEAMGVDGVIAAGAEMGGHTHPPDRSVHTFILIPQVARAVDIPVIAAGGMKDGRSLLAALSLGAQGISMGTRFLASEDWEGAREFKEAIINSEELDDEVIDELPLRVLKTPGLEKYKELIQNAEHGNIAEIEADKSTQAQSSGNIDEGIVISGQIATYIKSIKPVEEIINDIVHEAEQTYTDLESVFDS